MMITFMTTTSAWAVFAENGSCEIDNFVESQMRELHIPGLALAIVQGDQIMHLKGYGIADTSGRAVTPETLFIIGSTTKSFTALSVMQLVEQGKIELDAPVHATFCGSMSPIPQTRLKSL